MYLASHSRQFRYDEVWMLNIRLFGNLILVSRVSLQVRNWPRTSNQITSQIIQDIVSLARECDELDHQKRDAMGGKDIV